MAGHPRRTASITQHQDGFTIVELLIVVVVIAILAALTLVAYNGITKKASESTASANAATALRKIKAEMVVSEAYPSSLSSLGIQNGNGTTYQYSVNNTVNPKTFCVTVINAGIAFYVNQDGTTASGLCPGHSINGVVAPTIGGYLDISNDFVADYLNVTNPTTIPTGSWMVVFMAFNNDSYPSIAGGWTTILNRNTYGTLRVSLFGKIKEASDPDNFQVYTGVGSNTVNAALFWGQGAGPVSSWVRSASWFRDGTTTNQFITTAPSVTTTVPQSLILSMNSERTTATETDIVSIAGATKWFYVPQVGSTKIQPFVVGHAVKEEAGPTTPVVVTHVNSQINNGIGMQLVLPPANP